MAFHRLQTLRRLALPLLKRLSPGDITLRHPYTRHPFLLDAFRHKGYWFHGKRREAATMQLFERCLAHSQTVIEVGGHIGFVTCYLAHLVGEEGQIIVFEPGPNNLPYLRKNVAPHPQVTVVEQALSAETGTAVLYTENLTGQNNSLLPDFQTLARNQAMAFTEAAVSQVNVQTTSLDAFAQEKKCHPDAVKIDVEGAEWAVLQGMRQTLQTAQPWLMVEVTHHQPEVFLHLTQQGYRLYTPQFERILEPAALQGNTFCFQAQKHAALLKKLMP